jgi:hypothetical protein
MNQRVLATKHLTIDVIEQVKEKFEVFVAANVASLRATQERLPSNVNNTVSSLRKVFSGRMHTDSGEIPL